MPWTSALIGGLSGLTSNLIGGFQQLKATREYNKAQRELAEYQNEYNLEMWHQQNEYNSPVQQMQRYQDAGLNPNLIYSQGSPGNASEPASAAVPDVAMEDHSFKGRAVSEAINSALAQYAQSLQNNLVKEEIKLKKTQQDVNKQEANKTFLESVAQELSNFRSQFDNDKLPERYKAEMLGKYQDLYNSYVEGLIQELQKRYLEDSYDFRLSLLEYDVHKNYEEWHRAFNDNQYMLKHGYANKLAHEMQEIWNLKEVQNEIRSRTDLNYQTAEQLHQLTQNLVKQGKILDIDQEIKTWERDLKLDHGLLLEYLKVLPLGDVIDAVIDLIPGSDVLQEITDNKVISITEDANGDIKEVNTRSEHDHRRKKRRRRK